MERLSEQNLITPEAADLLISKRDGHMTLLYLYLCRTGCTDREKASRDLFLPPSTLNEAYERLVLAEILLADFLQDPVAGKIIIHGPGIMEKHDAQRGQWILYLSYDILALDIQGCVGP